MGHSHNCKTTEKNFTGTLGSESYYGGSEEYRINVCKDELDFGGDAEVVYSADLTIGRRWEDHTTIGFHDVLSDDKTMLLYGMRQLKHDLEDAIKYLESL